MLNNTSITDENVFKLNPKKSGATRTVKLSKFPPFKEKIERLKAEYNNQNQPIETPKEAEISKTNEIQNSQPVPEATENTVSKPIENVLPFTSEEVLLSKKDSIGLDVYKTIKSENIKIRDYQQDARRLRVNSVVVGNANRARNVLGQDELDMTNDESALENKKLDNEEFSELSLENKLESPDEDNVSLANEKYDSDAKLDEWLNKENSDNVINTNDAMLNEVSELQTKRNDNANSLATQKEILEALRARIANNEELCRERKHQLEEENLALTQELNDVLAEINQLTSLANEQEAFLGISSDDEELGKSK